MAILINDNSARVQYTATSGQTLFIVPFEFFSNGDLNVYLNETLITYNASPTTASEYSVTGAGVTGGGSITLGAGATVNDKILIVRDIPVQRVTDFPLSGPFPIDSLNTDLDTIVAIEQQLETKIDQRTLHLSETDRPNALIALPDFESRVGKLLGFNSNGQPIAVGSLEDGGGVIYASGILTTQVGTGAVQRYQSDKNKEVFTPEDFAAGAIPTQSELLAAMTAAVANNAVLRLKSGRTYTISQLSIPAGCVIEGNNAIIAIDGTLTGAVSALIVNDGCVIDYLRVTTPGTETYDVSVELTSNTIVDLIQVNCATQSSVKAIQITGDNNSIGKIHTTLNDYPVTIKGPDALNPIVNNHIGFITGISYVRGFKAQYADDGSLRGYLFKDRSPNSTVIYPGHNGIIVDDCIGWVVGDGEVRNSGEHAIRLGGGERGSSNWHFSVVRVEKSRGCGFKINPSNGVRCQNITIDTLQGIDVGNGSQADNTELLRLVDCDNVTIGSAMSDIQDETEAAAFVLKLNNFTNVRIGELGGNALNAGIVIDHGVDQTNTALGTGEISGTLLTVSDVTSGTYEVGTRIYSAGLYKGYITALGTGTGGVGTYTLSQSSTVAAGSGINGYAAVSCSGLYIDNYSGVQVSYGSGCQISMDEESISDFYINFAGAKGWNNYAVNFVGDPVIDGSIVFTGTIGGAQSVLFNNKPTNSLVQHDLLWQSQRTMADASLSVTNVAEKVYVNSDTTVALDPANGGIQSWTLTANSTATDSFAGGESMMLFVNDGTGYTITWPTMTWIGGSAPTLDTTALTVVELWKRGGVLYGALVGVA